MNKPKCDGIGGGWSDFLRESLEDTRRNFREADERSALATEQAMSARTPEPPPQGLPEEFHDLWIISKHDARLAVLAALRALAEARRGKGQR